MNHLIPVPSISATYFISTCITPFMIILGSAGLLLFSYKGYDKQDDIVCTIAGIFALVFANKYNKIGNGANKGNAKAGKIMGIIGIIGGVIATIIVLAFIFIVGAGFASLFSM